MNEAVEGQGTGGSPSSSEGIPSGILPSPRNLIYQIFPDRFAPAPGSSLEPACPPGESPHLWHAGGHLDGVVQHIQHLTHLGADAVYLTPIQPAPSNHKYDATSYLGVDHRLGGVEAFERLSRICQERNLGLILDGVFNHVGRKHEWVPNSGASYDSARPEYFRGTTWRGHGSMPELLTESEGVREALILGKDSVLEYWFRRGVTGWRLDCANDLGYDFCRNATRQVARLRDTHGMGQDGVIGEVMNFAADWTQDGILDGVMNYWFRECVLGLLQGHLHSSTVRAALQEQVLRFPTSGLLRSWNILSSHDTPRMASLLPQESQRRVALALQFVLPGVPVLYYGEELGMHGGADPDNRRPMDWAALDSKPQPGLMAWIQRLSILRRDNPVLRLGETRFGFVNPTSPLLVILRQMKDNPTDFAVLVVNPSDEEVPAGQTVLVPCDGMFDGLPMVDSLSVNSSSDPIQARSGALPLPKLDPMSAVLYLPQPRALPGYSFFKPCWGMQK